VYLLDTDVLSELRKPRCDAGVAKWFGSVSDSDLFLSAITFAEIERGIERQRASNPAFATELTAWLEYTLRVFGDRILPVTVNVARRWGRLAARIGNKELDLAIAATGLEHGLTIVTGNARHFERTEVSLLDPFRARPSRR
jgi:predicted nucleic acid-binding protein